MTLTVAPSREEDDCRRQQLVVNFWIKKYA